jgi:short-subunit dehydrogenase
VVPLVSKKTKLSILDISETSARSAISSLRAEFPSSTITFKKCDISNWDEQKAVFEEIYREVGSIDVVIANAGVSEKGNFLSKDEEPTKPTLTTLDVNLSGTLYSKLMQASLFSVL